MALIVETQEGLAAGNAKTLQGDRLGARHIGVETAQEHDAGQIALAFKALVGD